MQHHRHKPLSKCSILKISVYHLSFVDGEPYSCAHQKQHVVITKNPPELFGRSPSAQSTWALMKRSQTMYILLTNPLPLGAPLSCISPHPASLGRVCLHGISTIIVALLLLNGAVPHLTVRSVIRPIWLEAPDKTKACQQAMNRQSIGIRQTINKQ